MVTGNEEVRVDFSYLASEYHAGMISGLSLIAHNLEQWVAAKESVCLPPFTHICNICRLSFLSTFIKFSIRCA
jgi:hypothetical protein